MISIKMGNLSSINKIIPKSISKKYILGIIDPQNDFFQSGALEVSNSNEIIGPINELRCELSNIVDTFISLDTHPQNHISFASTHQKKALTKIQIHSEMKNGDEIISTQMLWPVHCVVDTHGNKIHDHIARRKSDLIIKKGLYHNVESYSAFGDEFHNKYENTGLNDKLKLMYITDIILVGLATDYCVYNTALDALLYGYNVHIILSCVRGVDPKTTKDAIDDLISKGVNFYENIDIFLQSI
jgi:nicotinamidase/pyrazinamidase